MKIVTPATIVSLRLFLVLVWLFGIQTANANIQASNDQKNTEKTPGNHDIYRFANQCSVLKLKGEERYLSKTERRYAFSEVPIAQASRVFMKASALGQYLLYDQDRDFITLDNKQLYASAKLSSEMTLNIPEYNKQVSAGEWQLIQSGISSFQLKNLKFDLWLSQGAAVHDQTQAVHLEILSSEACSPFPGSNIAAIGSITKTTHSDGSLWGFADPHTHLGGNHGFGGKVFHGGAFHRLGIEHALADCSKHHGEQGSKDLMAIIYRLGAGHVSTGDFLNALFEHLALSKPDHSTEGYPQMTSWSIHEASTHQSAYYQWIERAYLGGLRVLVEYMESTEVVCDIYKSLVPGESEADNCNEMVHIDHQLEKLLELQNYIDAQHGGPNQGWFRIAYSPQEARSIVESGKLAVILGIEIENPFDCFIDDRPGFEQCTDAMVKQRLNNYYQKGVRALFPSHKFVNAFSSGDGDAGILELGDYLNTGQWRQYVDCSEIPGDYLGAHSEGDKKSMFAGLANIPGLKKLNKWLSKHNDLKTQILPLYDVNAQAHCQQDGLTPLGRTLIEEMMNLGMIIDIGHSPKAALNDLVPMLSARNYPAAHTHASTEKILPELDGMWSKGLGSTCHLPNGESEMSQFFDDLYAHLDPRTGLPRKAMSYDFNGFASYATPRFGEGSQCAHEQEKGITYPFTSFDGDIRFDRLVVGERSYDFNTDGLANIGLYPDLIEEARQSGIEEEKINALFKTAEAYIRLWEKAEAAAHEHVNGQ